MLIKGELADQVKVVGAFAQCTTDPKAKVFAPVACEDDKRLSAAIGTVTVPVAVGQDAAKVAAACQKTWFGSIVGDGTPAWTAVQLGAQQSRENNSTFLCWLPFDGLERLMPTTWSDRDAV